jgi:hypothetical protein
MTALLENSDHNPPKGYHDVHCYMCGRKCGHVTHYGGDRELLWCQYCADIPHYCLDCYLIGQKFSIYKPNPVRKEAMFKEKKTKAGHQMMNIRQFNQGLHDFKPGDSVLVVDSTRNKLVCLVRFMDLPDSAELVKAVKFTK